MQQIFINVKMCVLQHIIIPIFYWYDLFYQKFYQSNNKEEEEIFEEKHIYDLENDVIIINYMIEKNQKYQLKIKRKLDINLKKEIEILKKTNENQFTILSAILNESTDITIRLIKILGPNNKHDLICKLQIKNLLNKEEINNFQNLEIMDMNCNIKTFNNLNDYIL
jgi:hypothetical protein